MKDFEAEATSWGLADVHALPAGVRRGRRHSREDRLPDRIGNIYAQDFERALVARSCPAAACHCHIGYAHMPELRFRELFDDGLLERVLPMH